MAHRSGKKQPKKPASQATPTPAKPEQKQRPPKGGPAKSGGKPPVPKRPPTPRTTNK